MPLFSVKQHIFRTIFMIVALVAIMTPGKAASAPLGVADYDQLTAALASHKDVKLTADITNLTDRFDVSKGSDNVFFLDLNGHTLHLAKGIQIPSGYTLIIRDKTPSQKGLLLVDNVDDGHAGIGSSHGIFGGGINIQSGTIHATGGKDGAGIGGTTKSTFNRISVSGGPTTKVIATGKGNAPGIGSKSNMVFLLYGGDITATAEGNAPGIGDIEGTGKTSIAISYATITATGGNYSAAIGTGSLGEKTNLKIWHSTVTAINTSEFGTALGTGRAATGKAPGFAKFEVGNSTINLNGNIHIPDATLDKVTIKEPSHFKATAEAQTAKVYIGEAYAEATALSHDNEEIFVPKTMTFITVGGPAGTVSVQKNILDITVPARLFSTFTTDIPQGYTVEWDWNTAEDNTGESVTTDTTVVSGTSVYRKLMVTPPPPPDTSDGSGNTNTGGFDGSGNTNAGGSNGSGGTNTGGSTGTGNTNAGGTNGSYGSGTTVVYNPLQPQKEPAEKPENPKPEKPKPDTKPLQGKPVKLPTTRIAGPTRVETSLAFLKQAPSKRFVVLATGNNYPDSLMGGLLAKELNTSVVLTTGQDLEPTILNSLIESQTTTVVILGGFNAVPAAVERTLRANNIAVERIAGATRYDTATRITEKIADLNHHKSDDVFVVAGDNFLEVLPTSVATARTNGTMLIVNQHSKINVSPHAKVWCVGKVACDLLPSAQHKIVGNTPVETAYALASKSGASTAVVATTKSFADSLTATSFTAYRDATIVLATQEGLVVPKSVTKLVYAGGAKALDPNLSVYQVTKQ